MWTAANGAFIRNCHTGTCMPKGPNVTVYRPVLLLNLFHGEGGNDSLLGQSLLYSRFGVYVVEGLPC